MPNSSDGQISPKKQAKTSVSIAKKGAKTGVFKAKKGKKNEKFALLEKEPSVPIFLSLALFLMCYYCYFYRVFL